MIKDENDLRKPLLDIFPDEWSERLGIHDNLEFRNIEHFKYTVSRLTQKHDNNCNVSYAKALDDLIQGKTSIKTEEINLVKNLVKSNLFKRGLITEEVYENFKYSDSGTQVGVDVAKFAAGDPNCVITPSRQYISYFYELYVSVSYSHWVPNEEVVKNVVKLLSTIEELERQKIFIKIVLVFPANNINNENNFFMSIPLYSHNEPKTAEGMCSVINERLLRKFSFAIVENIYGSDLVVNYGTVIELPGTMNIGHEFNEIDFFNLVKETTGA